MYMLEGDCGRAADVTSLSLSSLVAPFLLKCLCLFGFCCRCFELMRVPLRENKNVPFSSLVLSTQISPAGKRTALSYGVSCPGERYYCLVSSQIEHPETLNEFDYNGKYLWLSSHQTSQSWHHGTSVVLSPCRIPWQEESLSEAVFLGCDRSSRLKLCSQISK